MLKKRMKKDETSNKIAFLQNITKPMQNQISQAQTFLRIILKKCAVAKEKKETQPSLNWMMKCDEKGI